jgi:glycosyltransferase involved in cell wall biosynthesis
MRVLYVSQTGMTEPLGQSQVIPYLAGLARVGYRIEIVTFEPEGVAPAAVTRVREQLGDHGIDYVWLERRRAHDLATKAHESGKALLRLVGRALANRPRIIHARSYLPAAVARATRMLTPGSRFVFDCRGLLGDEYVDFGHWQRGSFNYRLLKQAERYLFGSADAVVVLTERLRRWLCDEEQLVAQRTPVAVIPCCVDLARFVVDDTARARSRQALGAGDRFVLAYSGTLGAWYCEAQMAELFAMLHRRRPALFAVFTRADSEKLRAELRRRGIADRDVIVQAGAQSEMPALLAGADAAVSFAEPRFSKIASSPVKVAEYLAVGLPVVVNRGVGDQDALQAAHPGSLFDGGLMGDRELDAVAERLAALPLDSRSRRQHRLVATARFDLEAIGIARYRQLYEQLDR